jgi:membrane-associated phospholipid phosphatase
MYINALDSYLYHLINQGTANSAFDTLMPFLSERGYTLLFPYVAYMLWVAFRRKKEGDSETFSLALWTIVVSVTACFLTDWTANELKHVIGRIRPCHVEEGVRLLGACTQSSSMPSSHASNSFAYAFPLFFMTRGYMRLRWRIYPLVIAGFIAYSRPYIGVHYPGDIAVGAVLGLFISTLIIDLFGNARLRYKSKPYTTLLYGSLLTLTIFRIFYVLHGPLDLGPDEAHYWEWSRHLDLSYYSKGPMIAYLIALGTALFGNTVFGVRSLAIVLSVMSSLLLYKLVFEMYRDEAAAVGSALLYQIIPLFTAFSVIFSIDSPFLFFWILSLFLFHRVISAETADAGHQRSGHDTTVQWVLLGISLGLGLLSKYTMAFFHLGMLLFLLMSDRRYLLRTFKPYAATLISLIVFSPVIIWNAMHDWVTLRHTAGQAHIAEGFNFSIQSLGEFLGSQAGIVTPVIFILIFYTLHMLYRSEKGYKSIFLGAFSVPVIAFFTLKSIQGKVEANWAMTGYITGLIAVAWYCLGSNGHVGAGSTRKRKAVFWAGAAIALLVTIVSHYPSIIKLPPKLDPSTRLRGWHQLRDELDPIYKALASQGPVLLFSDRYQISSELAFYLDSHPATYCINLGRRMDQYDLWPGMNEEAARIRHEGGVDATQPINGIYVTWGISNVPPPVAKAFDRFEKKVIQVYDKGTQLRVYTVIICYNFKGLETGAIETY